MKPFISLCMIVKNEEKVLRRCLESVTGFMDEIVIIDTGSTDSTKEIAREYTAKIFDFEWTKNFAEARNFAASKASGKWILSLDADEYVDRANVLEVINLMKRSSSKVDFYNTTVVHFIGSDAEETIKNSYPKIYRNIPQIKYHRPIHESLMKEGNDYIIRDSGLKVFHTGYLKQTLADKNKTVRNTELLLQELKLKGENPLDLFYLGNEYAAGSQYMDAINAYNKSLSMLSDFNPSWVAICYVKLINCLIESERYGEALDKINDGEKHWPNSPDLMFLKAYTFSKLHRLDDAKIILETMTLDKSSFNNVLVSDDFLYANPHQLLGLLYEKEKSWQLAFEQYLTVNSINPNDWRNKTNLLKLMFKRNDPADILKFIQDQKWLHSNLDFFRLIRLSIENGDIGLAQLLVKQLPPTTNMGNVFSICFSIYLDDYSEAEKQIKDLSIQEIQQLIDIGILNLNELNLINLYTDISEIIGELKLTQMEKAFTKWLLKNDKSNPDRQMIDQYIYLLNTCILYQNFDLIDVLLSYRISWSENLDEVNQRVGHLFYRHGFEDLAMDFYNSEVINQVRDSRTLLNLIEINIGRQLYTEALQMCKLVKDLKLEEDFRLVKYEIDILYKLGKMEELKVRIQQGLKQYPDSVWLKNLMVSNLI
jgi:glycosyltransferase involved in cell wall biosynthesis